MAIFGAIRADVLDFLLGCAQWCPSREMSSFSANTTKPIQCSCSKCMPSLSGLSHFVACEFACDNWLFGLLIAERNATHRLPVLDRIATARESDICVLLDRPGRTKDLHADETSACRNATAYSEQRARQLLLALGFQMDIPTAPRAAAICHSRHDQVTRPSWKLRKPEARRVTNSIR
jgi:hypothetical protein